MSPSVKTVGEGADGRKPERILEAQESATRGEVVEHGSGEEGQVVRDVM